MTSAEKDWSAGEKEEQPKRIWLTLVLFTKLTKINKNMDTQNRLFIFIQELNSLHGKYCLYETLNWLPSHIYIYIYSLECIFFTLLAHLNLNCPVSSERRLDYGLFLVWDRAPEVTVVEAVSGHGSLHAAWCSSLWCWSPAACSHHRQKTSLLWLPTERSQLAKSCDLAHPRNICKNIL